MSETRVLIPVSLANGGNCSCFAHRIAAYAIIHAKQIYTRPGRVTWVQRLDFDHAIIRKVKIVP